MTPFPIDPEFPDPNTTARSTRPKVIYAIIDRPPRKHWLRVGLAFVNRDGSLNVRIDAVPLTGSLHIRDEPQRAPMDESLTSPTPDALPGPPPSSTSRPRATSRPK